MGQCRFHEPAATSSGETSGTIAPALGPRLRPSSSRSPGDAAGSAPQLELGQRTRATPRMVLYLDAGAGRGAIRRVDDLQARSHFRGFVTHVRMGRVEHDRGPRVVAGALSVGHRCAARAEPQAGRLSKVRRPRGRAGTEACPATGCTPCCRTGVCLTPTGFNSGSTPCASNAPRSRDTRCMWYTLKVAVRTPCSLLLTHGCPPLHTSIPAVSPLLSDPGAHGANPADAFTVVVPSLPGYAFSGPAPPTGMTGRQVARLWHELMT